MTIVGANLTGLTAPQVTIGGTPCVNLTVISATQMVCEAPVKTAGSQALSIGGITQTASVVYYADSYPTLQSMTTDTCPVTPTLARDTRDSQLYYVNKMQDNACWMLDNLKFGGDGNLLDGGVGSGTNAGELFWPGKPGGPSGGNYLTIDGTNTTGTNLDIAKYTDPNSIAYCYNLDNSVSTTKCGFLYNWYSATNGTGTSSMASGNASGSICPAGWRLPTGGSSGEFNALQVAMGMASGTISSGLTDSTHMWRLPNGSFRAPYSGVYSNSFLNQGSRGYFWSSTALTATNSYGPYFGSTTSAPANNGSKYFGNALRCRL
jgi:uncharacterized protein (TIGR02145 family)